MLRHKLSIGLLLLAPILPLTANAALEWDFACDTSGNPDLVQCGSGTNYSAFVDYTFDSAGTSNGSSDVSTVISGWSTTGLPTGSGNTNNHDYALRHWSGLGLDRSNDGHTIDNIGYDDYVVFSFEEAISLQSFSLGYTEGDWDVSILAFTGDENDLYEGTTAGAREDHADNVGTYRSEDPNRINGTIDVEPWTLDDGQASSITNNGWTAVGHYSNPNTSGESFTALDWAPGTNPTAGGSDTGEVIFSSHWIIGAYMANISAVNVGNPHWTQDNDGFKLATITGISCPAGSTNSWCGGTTGPGPGPGPGVPAPATLLLMLLGLPLLRSKVKARR